jgi:hypothetical protein
MMKVFEKGGEIVKAELEYGIYRLTIPFETEPSASVKTS